MATATQPDVMEVSRGQKPKQEALLEAGTDAEPLSSKAHMSQPGDTDWHPGQHPFGYSCGWHQHCSSTKPPILFQIGPPEPDILGSTT